MKYLSLLLLFTGCTHALFPEERYVSYLCALSSPSSAYALLHVNASSPEEAIFIANQVRKSIEAKFLVPVTTVNCEEE